MVRKRPRKRGRPRQWDPRDEKLVSEICARIAGGASLRDLTRMSDMPSEDTIRTWLNDPDLESFHVLYARAREEQADHEFDEIKAIADDAAHSGHAFAEQKVEEAREAGIEDEKELTRIYNRALHSGVESAKVRIDARKWRASRMRPRKYGTPIRLDAEVSTPEGKAVEVRHSLSQKLQRLAESGERKTS